MHFSVAAFAALLASNTALGAPLVDVAAEVDARAPFGIFSDVTVFVPPRDYIVPRTLYARTALLPNGDLLATWENYINETLEHTLVYFPIFKSSDGGETWKQISNVTDQVNNWGLRYQPFLYVLPQSLGTLPAGTILLAGNSIPTNLSNTKIDLYASHDSGYTWHFVSSIASGGEALPDNGLTPVWEPFLMIYKNKLVCYYSDQRDPAHGQKLVHQVSSNGLSWGPVVDDVAYETYTARPGMTTLAHLPNGKWIMTYEYGGGPGFSSYSFPVYYRISDSPLTFNSSAGYPVIAPGVAQPTSSPYVVWSSYGGVNGTIVVTCGSETPVYLNTKLGDVGSWVAMNTPQGQSYSRHLRIMQNLRYLLIMGAGPLGGSQNNVSLSVIDLL